MRAMFLNTIEDNRKRVDKETVSDKLLFYGSSLVACRAAVKW